MPMSTARVRYVEFCSTRPNQVQCANFFLFTQPRYRPYPCYVEERYERREVARDEADFGGDRQSRLRSLTSLDGGSSLRIVKNLKVHSRDLFPPSCLAEKSGQGRNESNSEVDSFVQTTFERLRAGNNEFRRSPPWPRCKGQVGSVVEAKQTANGEKMPFLQV
jgi:hypothetical protein